MRFRCQPRYRHSLQYLTNTLPTTIQTALTAGQIKDELGKPLASSRENSRLFMKPSSRCLQI